MDRQDVPRLCKLERYYAQYEFTTKYLLCCSDVQALSMADVIKMADSECKSLWDNLKLSYTESSGHPLLRDEVAKLHLVNTNDVLIITPQEGIYIAMHCLVDYVRRTHGDESTHVIATYPAYQSLYENVFCLGCDTDYWTVKESPEGWTFSLDDLKSLIKKNTRLLVVNFPHNPTGYVPSAEDWDSISQLCQERNIFLFSDEMYRLSNNDSSAPLTSACSFSENAMTLFGMSKTFAMPGVRIGWLVTRHQGIMESMKSFKDYTTICSSGPSEILSIIGLRNKDAILDRTRRITTKNLKLLDIFFKDYDDIFVWRAPTACTTGLLKLKGWILDLGEGGASGFCGKLVKEAEVLLLPSEMYDFRDDCVRLGFGREDLAEALIALREFLEDNKPQKC